MFPATSEAMMIPLISMKFLIPLALPIFSGGMRSGSDPWAGPCAIFEVTCNPRYPMKTHSNHPPSKQEKEDKIKQGTDQNQGTPSPPPGAPIVADRPADGLQQHGNDQPEEGQRAEVCVLQAFGSEAEQDHRWRITCNEFHIKESPTQ